MAEEEARRRSSSPTSTGNLRTVFIISNLDTRLAMNVSDSDTVALLKQKAAVEHSLCFPHTGDIQILAMKVRRKSHFYHLSDSMLVKSAFDGFNKTWFLHMDTGPMAVVRQDKFTMVGFSKPKDSEHADKPSSLLGHSRVPGNEVPPQNGSNLVENYTVLSNHHENLVSLDNQQSPTDREKAMLSQLRRSIDCPALQVTESLPCIRTSDVVAAKNRVLEIDISPQDIDEDYNVGADKKTVSSLDSAKKVAPKRSRAVKVGKGLVDASQKKQKMEVTKNVSSVNQSERIIMENHANTGNVSEMMFHTENKNLENLSSRESGKKTSIPKRSTRKPQEEIASEDFNTEKKKRKRKASNPLSKVDSDLLSENNDENINGSAIIGLSNQEGFEEDNVQSSGRWFVEEIFVKSIDSIHGNSSKDINNDDTQIKNVLSTNVSLLRSRQEDPTNFEEIAADSLLLSSSHPEYPTHVSSSHQDNVNAKETVNKGKIEDLTRQLETEGEVLGEVVTVRDNKPRRTKKRLPATKNSVHVETSVSDKTSDAEKIMQTGKSKSRSNSRSLDEARKTIQYGNAAVQGPECTEITLTELLNDKGKKSTKSTKSRSFSENYMSSVTEEVDKISDVDGVLEWKVNGDKELKKDNNMSSNLVNSLQVLQDVTPSVTTSKLPQANVQDGHDGLNVLETSKSINTVVVEKRRKSSKLTKNSLRMMEVNQKSEHGSLIESCDQVGEDALPNVGDSFNEKQVDLLRDEWIVPVKKAKDIVLEDKKSGPLGDQVDTQDGNGASRGTKLDEITVCEALGDKSKAKSKSKKSRTDVKSQVRTTKEVVHQKADNLNTLEVSQTGDLLLDGGITQAEKTKYSKANSFNVMDAEKVCTGSELVGESKYIEMMELNAGNERGKSKESQTHAENDILDINVDSNRTDASRKDANTTSKNLEGPETQKRSDSHLLALTGKNSIRPSEAEKDEPRKKRNPRSEKVKHDIIESGMNLKKDGYFKPDAATKTNELGDADNGTQRAENENGDMLNIYLSKAVQSVELKGRVVRKETSAKSPQKEKADYQSENLNSNSTQKVPGPELARKKNSLIPGKQKKKAVPGEQRASRAKKRPIEEINASSDNTENLEGIVFITNQHEQIPSPINAYRLAARKPHDEVLGKVINGSNQKKSFLAESDSIFQHSESESSQNTGEVNDSDSNSDILSDNSVTYSGQVETPTLKKLSNMDSPRTGSTAHATDDGKSRTTNGGDICLSQSMTAKKPLGTILRNSYSYRKAKIMASQSLLETTNSELPDFVPDSQAAAAFP